MTDYRELMEILSVPRPNGSASERETKCRLQDWLTRRGIPHRVHEFRLYPYFFECIGLWLILSRTVLAIAIWERWGWVTLPIALLGLLGGTLDVAFHLPLLTWPGARRGENILIEFETPEARQEIVFSAHYDSKTELLDHSGRMFFLKRLRFGIALTMLLGFWGLLQQGFANSPWGQVIFWMGAALAVVMLMLAWGFGLHLSLGRFIEPSQGAVDNGAACAILLGLAERLATGQIPIVDKKITIAIFTGEEVNMQGSRAYVRSRVWDLPVATLNLEVMAQDGETIYWQQDGNAFRLIPTTQWMNEAVATAVEQVTGQVARPAGPVNSDGFSFLSAGIPATTIGTLDKRLGETGFHRPTDHLGRVVFERLPQSVEILEEFICSMNKLPSR
ncbi:MAG TPA: M28 family peptidase [Anaerolineales bacterium]|nr:M28 family peptidase [Anaerolineales bacterium]